MKKIGKYEVCGLLGRGGMSTVYKVRMPKIDKVVALKLLSPHPHLVSLLGMQEVRNRFEREAATMADLRHPNIAAIWDFDEAEGTPFLVMEYYCNNLGLIIGETYRLEVASRILSPDRTIHYVSQVLGGLSRLHQAEIIHRDIKPYNILVTDEDQVKITDFGLSKLRGETLRRPPNLMVGSPYYAAPEQEDDPEAVDPRADLYSVGVMTHRMLTGSLMPNEVRRPGEYHLGLSEEWASFVEKATAKQREDRFASALEMLNSLNGLAAAWERMRKKTCLEMAPLLAHKRSTPRSRQLRNKSIKVGPRQAREVLELDDLWQPLHYLDNDFQENDDSTVFDWTTGLAWQRGGSDFPVTWSEAHLFIERLNREHFAGRNNWRLPTVSELISLLRKKHDIGDSCIDPPFAQNRRWLWSADRRSFVAAWYVNIDMGFVSWQDFSCYFFVRAVCTQDVANRRR